MVTNRKKDSGKTPEKQGAEHTASEPNKINGSTSYDFNGRNLTPYGGLLPVITMLEKLDFQPLLEETLTSKRIPRAMDLYRFVLGIVLGLYIGFPRLNQLRFIARDPILTGILKVGKLPVQSTFWRFVNGLHRNVARQILTVMRTMRERVWAAAHVKLETVTIDTDTTVHTLYGQQMGGRKGYNPKNKGKKSYQPMLTFIAETREYVWGELRNGDRPDGKQIGQHIRNVCAALPPGVKQIYGRAGPRGHPWILLRGRRRSIRAMQRPLRHLGTQDVAAGRVAAAGWMETVEEDGCGYGMRIPLSAGRMEQGIPVRRPALREGARGSGKGGK
jgi:hypothetical protein